MTYLGPFLYMSDVDDWCKALFIGKADEANLMNLTLSSNH